MKKIISILMVAALMAAFLVTSVFATEAPQIVVDSQAADAGDEVVMTVSIVNNPGITNGKMDVVYDETALELVGIDTSTGILATTMAFTNGAAMNFMTFADIKTDGVLFTVTFKVLDTAATADYKVEILVDYIDGDTQSGIAFEVVPGTVSVTAAPVEHDLVHVEAVEPGCHMAGNIEHWYCTKCEMVWQDEALTQVTNHLNVVLPATGGEVVHVEAVEPGCHFTGNIEHWYCVECEQVWQDEALTQLTNHMNVIVPALGGEVVHVEAKEATCTENGNIEHWYCETCEQVWQDEALTQLTNHLNVIVAGAHDLVHVEAVEAGCHMEGNIEHWYCKVCETVWADEALTQVTNHLNVIVPALGGEVVHMEAVEAGCHFTGNIEHWYCVECEQVWQDEALTQLTNHMNVIVPALGGEVVHVEAVAPTCTENGNIEHWYCETCEQVWQDEALTQLTNHLNVIVPAAHTYVNGVCSVCGEEDKNVPNTGDMSAIVFALVAVSGMGLVALTKKKED